MHKEIIKGNPKVIMRKLIYQWQNITDEDLAQIENLYETDYKKYHHKPHKDPTFLIKN